MVIPSAPCKFCSDTTGPGAYLQRRTLARSTDVRRPIFTGLDGQTFSLTASSAKAPLS